MTCDARASISGGGWTVGASEFLYLSIDCFGKVTCSSYSVDIS